MRKTPFVVRLVSLPPANSIITTQPSVRHAISFAIITRCSSKPGFALSPLSECSLITQLCVLSLSISLLLEATLQQQTFGRNENIPRFADKREHEVNRKRSEQRRKRNGKSQSLATLGFRLWKFSSGRDTSRSEIALNTGLGFVVPLAARSSSAKRTARFNFFLAFAAKVFFFCTESNGGKRSRTRRRESEEAAQPASTEFRVIIVVGGNDACMESGAFRVLTGMREKLTHFTVRSIDPGWSMMAASVGRTCR